MRVIGIDPDTRSITIAVIEDIGDHTCGILKHRIEARGRRAEERLPDLMDQISELVNSRIFFDAYVYIERPFVGPNRKAAIDVGMVVGALRMELHNRGISHSLVDPGVWKKAVLGNGQATKDEIRLWAIKAFDLEPTLAQDYYDAAAIAAFGWNNLNVGRHVREG